MDINLNGDIVIGLSMDSVYVAGYHVEQTVQNHDSATIRRLDLTLCAALPWHTIPNVFLVLHATGATLIWKSRPCVMRAQQANGVPIRFTRYDLFCAVEVWTGSAPVAGDAL
jgi:hypothetical protein